MGEHKNKTMQPSKEQIEREVAAKYMMKRASLAEAFAVSLCRNAAVADGRASAASAADFAVQLADALMERLYNRPMKEAQ